MFDCAPQEESLLQPMRVPPQASKAVRMLSSEVRPQQSTWRAKVEAASNRNQTSRCPSPANTQGATIGWSVAPTLLKGPFTPSVRGMAPEQRSFGGAWARPNVARSAVQASIPRARRPAIGQGPKWNTVHLRRTSNPDGNRESGG